MTHRDRRTPISDALEALTTEGSGGMAEAIRLLRNEAVNIERSAFLGAAPHERTETRRGYANGIKPRQIETRAGTIDLQIPQVRDVVLSALLCGLGADYAVPLVRPHAGEGTREENVIWERSPG